MKLFNSKILNKIASSILVLAMLVSMVGNIMVYSTASAYSSLGTNKALGSPILNENFSSNNWNKWEMVVWGIFLSNFTTPFLDDYNSAFNIDSGYGSKGSGVQALQFGSGRDPANSSVIQNLLDYAVNQQAAGGSKTIYVHYNNIKDGEISELSVFKSGGASVEEPIDVEESPDSEETTEETTEEATGTVAGETINSTSEVRAATVADLFLTGTPSSGTYVEIKGNKLFQTDYLNPVNYTSMEGIKEGRVPTFAVSGSHGTYEIVLDYTDAWDLSMVTAAVSKAATIGGDLTKEALDNLKDMIANPSKYPLVLDCFGNICTSINGTLRVVIPAAANQYLTANPSYNLVNSLLFNSNMSSAGANQLVVNGGQGKNSKLTDWAGGTLAFTNGMPGIPAGSALLFYDTDTIVMQDALAESNRAPFVNIGELYTKLFECNINNYINGKYPFKIEIANAQDIDFGDDKVKDTVNVITKLINQFTKAPSNKALTTIKTDTGDLDIFGDPVVVSVQLYPGQKIKGFGDWVASLFGTENTFNYNAIHRQFVNYTYQAYKQSLETTVGTVSSADVKKAFEANTHQELYKNLLTNDTGSSASTLFSSFIARHTEFYKYDDIKKLLNFKTNGNPQDLEGNSAAKIRKEASGSHGRITPEGKVNDNNSPFGRSVLVYPTSEVMRSVGNILGVREGTEFAVYSTYIYLTYLDWYGVLNNSLTSLSNPDMMPHDLNTGIFDGNSDVTNVDINKITDTMTDEQKEKQIKDWTYMLLDPVKGREYRSQMVIAGISDWIYDTYQKIVYGDASSYYDTGSGVTSRNSTGFLTVEPYSENFMTAWFVNNYSYFATILIGVFFALTIVMGLLKKRKFSWFLVSILAMVNMILILPATGEVVPLISNSFVQSMFSDKMSYWTISESVTNATMESDYTDGTLSSGYLSSLTQEEQAQVVNLVKNLNVLYTDRSLSIKQDISKKVTQLSTTDYEEIQQLRSARWMLPMVMRQFTASDMSANYVYVPLADIFDDLSNMYWFYNPADAAFAKTVTASQTASVGSGAAIPVYNDHISNKHNPSARTVYYVDYVDTLGKYNPDEVAYKQKSYEQHPDIGANVHTFSYILNEEHLIAQPAPNYADYKSYDEWAEAWARILNNGSSTILMTKEAHIEDVADTYSRFDRGTIDEDFGYLWMTESPLHFFYQGIKDSFELDGSVGSLAGELQGSYVEQKDKAGNPTGKEVRKTFMHANDTGYVRDVLDLEELFTNTIPYLYAVQLKAEGYGDVAGEFGEDEFCTNLAGYEKNNKSWIFRSNWVTKLMEGPDYNKSAKIRDKDGNEIIVANMMMPSCYPTTRPMVFSEAQMYSLGLEERDLSLVELKCIEVNKEVSKQWTLLINYVSVPGITKEVLVRQMALDALLTFNAEFTPAGLLNSAYAMYPTGIDLRSITFDSVMKMIMLNVTHNTSYIYGDTMQTIVEDSDIFTSILLLITAFICVFLIPLARNFTLGLIFFLGLWAIIHALFRESKSKAKVSCGYFVSNVLFLIMTLAYYCAFKTIMAMTSTDEVLSLTQIEINTGNPVWCLIFILVISGIYCFGMYKMIIFCTKNYMDMGFEIYASIANMATNGIANSIDKLGSKITGDDTRSTKTRGRSGKKQDPIEVTSGDDDRSVGGSGEGGGGSGSGGNKRKNSTGQSDAFETSSYTDGRYTDGDFGSESIDNKIKSGASNINIRQYNNIDEIDRAIRHEQETMELSNKHAEDAKRRAQEYNSRGSLNAARSAADQARTKRTQAHQAEANIKVLKTRREQLIAENKRAEAHNAREIDNI